MGQKDVRGSDAHYSCNEWATAGSDWRGMSQRGSSCSVTDGAQGEVVLNKYCNIMQALDPKSTYADELFNTVVSYAVANNISNPLFPLDEKAAKEQKEWLYDAMRELIVKVLSKDSSLPFTVATELKNDMDKLIKDWAIVDKKTNEDIAKAIADEAVELIGNIVMYMQHLGDGFKALARLSAFKSATALINKGIEKITSIRKTGFPFLKGTMVILVVSTTFNDRKQKMAD